MLVSAPSSSSFSLGGSGGFYCLGCHVEPMSCSTSYGFSGSSIKAPFELQRVSQDAGLRLGPVSDTSLSFIFFLCYSAVMAESVESSFQFGNQSQNQSQIIQPQSQLITTKLTENNFLIWRQQILTTVRGYGLEDYLSGKIPVPEKFGVDSNTSQRTLNPEYIMYHSFRRENLFFGTARFHWLPQRHDICISQISVAADYSDSVPDSSSYVTRDGYHPLEELRDHGRVRDTMPTSAEIARNAVEANNRALLIFPSIVHCEPHEQISWAEFEYVIDDFGDIFIEVYDGQNILQDHGASNPVTALIGMDISHYESRKMDPYDDNILDIDAEDDVFFADDYFEVEDSSKTDILVEWGMPENATWTHPVYFAKCLTKAIDVEHAKLMDHPSNSVAVWGFLKPTFIDEELYLRRLFNDEDSDGDTSDCKDGDIVSFSSRDDGRCGGSTIYRLDITKIELFSVYGVQSMVGVQDFQYAEPDVLVHSIPSILERIGQMGSRCSVALKALCKKKGLHVEGANLIGVDSLGMDVRVSSGTEVRTHRFSFKARATSECAADKQIQQLLFPRSRRKN